METARYRQMEAEEFDDVISAIERFFDIRLPRTEIAGLSTYRDLQNLVIRKVDEQETGMVSGQQMFYRIRTATARITGCNRDLIHPHTLLASVFPRHQRRKNIRRLQKSLGMKLDILTNNSALLAGMIILLMVSALLLFFHVYAVFLMAFAIVVIFLGLSFGKDFSEDSRTFTDLTLKLAGEENLRRKSQAEARHAELEKQIASFFIHRLGISSGMLSRVQLPGQLIM